MYSRSNQGKSIDDQEDVVPSSFDSSTRSHDAM